MGFITHRSAISPLEERRVDRKVSSEDLTASLRRLLFDDDADFVLLSTLGLAAPHMADAQQLLVGLFLQGGIF